MNGLSKRVCLTTGTLIIIALSAGPTFTQSSTPESALLTEVRLLRQAIEALAGNGSRIQVVFGRLQLQEQRTTSAVRRLEDARSALARHVIVVDTAADRIKQLQEAASDARRTAEEQRAIEDSIVQLKVEAGHLEAERARLATAEAEAAQSVGLEQARWSELNQQLEELERSLIKRR
jgi:DNA repair exonuclease SbcCD ATPase subunit